MDADADINTINNVSNVLPNLPMDVGNDNYTLVANQKKPKNKIFQTIDTNINAARQSIKQAKCAGFTLKQTNPNAPIKISVNNHNEITTIRDVLKKEKISFHEFKWESERQQCFLIRGLVGVTEDYIPEILDHLIGAGVPAEAKLSPFVTGYMRANRHQPHNHLLKLVLPPNFDDQILKQIRFIDHVAVSFEKIKSKPLIQCVNCQRFGHTASGCQHAHRCVKCGENHFINKGIKLLCCNCGGEHTANNLSSCSFFLKNHAMRSTPAKSSPSTFSGQSSSRGTSQISKDISYAAADKSSSNVNLIPNNQPTKDIDALFKKIYVVYQLVLKHESTIQKLLNNG